MLGFPAQLGSGLAHVEVQRLAVQQPAVPGQRHEVEPCERTHGGACERGAPAGIGWWQRSSARNFALPYASNGRHGVSSVTGLCSGMPNTALDDVCTTFATRASRAATSRFAVPPTLTSSKSARSF